MGGECLAQALHIRVLDVEEGQAILLHQDTAAVLIDTGHAGKARSVLDRISELGIKRLDYLFLTHLHPDHASGYFRMQEAFPLVKVRDNCYPLEHVLTPDMMRWVDHALKKNTQRKCIKSGDQFEWGSSVIKVLWPLNKPVEKEGINHTSLVLEILHNGKRLLIMGDADRRAEIKLLQKGLLKPVDVLIVGHHGAKDATSEELLNVIRPPVSAISINHNNLRGYPSPAVVKRLKQSGSEVYTTYEQGELHFIF